MREMTNELGSSPLTRGKPPPPASSARAHPRSRGENCLAVCQSFQYTGSSPLTRGKPRPRATLRRQPGIIPAHAGKTNQSGPPLAQHRDHPRSRGENDDSLNEAIQEVGSSPLTRGKRSGRAAKRLVQGIIPAHAGKTRSWRRLRPRPRDHPRSRRENRCHSSAIAIPKGSSPLTRGKHVGETQVQDRLGLIPAHAGKTRSCLVCPRRPRAHPRSRGENPTLLITTPHVQGSSPLTRGKHRGGGLDLRDDGLIPTHAGKTPRSRRYGTSRWAHPHSRGENRKSLLPTASQYGSSPLTRGKHRVCVHHLIITGLIPAHAGKTRFATRQTGSGRAHPRSRGENTSMQNWRPFLKGSSPLTRGKREGRHPGLARVGIIPAHAGKTPSRPSSALPTRDHPRSRGENLE